MLRVNHLLCLVSPAVASSAALRWGGALASSVGAALHVLPLGETGPATLEQVLRDQQVLPPNLEAIEARGGAVLDERDPSATVRRYVKKAGIDLLVLDAPGTHGPVPPMAAAPTRPVIEHVDRPVIVVGEETPTRPNRILVTTDLSDRSFEALRHATALAALHDASVELLHVLDTSPYVALTPVDRLSLGRTTLSEHRARHALKQFLERDRLADVPIRPRVVFGDPADRISHVVNGQAVDLLVLASHGTGGRTERPLGQVADRVLRRVTCPVFLVRPDGASLFSEGQDGTS